jgi:hypothetical protein
MYKNNSQKLYNLKRQDHTGCVVCVNLKLNVKMNEMFEWN